MKIPTILFLILTLTCNWINGSRNLKLHHVMSAPNDEPEVKVEGVNVESVLIEKMFNDDQSSRTDVKSFTKLVNHHLDGLMVRFRSRVFNLYKKITCGDGLCDPWSPELGLSQTDILHKPTALKIDITNITTWHECPLHQNVDSYIVFRKALRSFYVIGSSKSAEISLFEIEDNGQCKFLESYNASTINPCFATFDTEELPLLLVGPCGIQTKTSQYVNVYLITGDQLKLVQVIESRNLQLMFTLQHRNQHCIFFLSLDEHSEQYCNVYKWMHTQFEYKTNFKLYIGKTVKSFSHGRQSYIVSTNYETVNDSPVTIWQFGKNKKSVDLKLYQILSDCNARDVEVFTVGGLQFLAVACFPSAKNESYLYWWTGSQFLMWQSMQSSNILSWIALKLNNDDTALIQHTFEKSHHILHVYQLDNGYYWPNKVSLTIKLFSQDNYKITMRGFQHLGMNLVTSIDNTSHKSKFITYRLQMEVNPPKMFATNEDNEELGCLQAVSLELEEGEIKLQILEKAILQLQQYKGVYPEVSSPKKIEANYDCQELHDKVSQMESRIGKADKILMERKERERQVNRDSLTVNRLTVRGSATIPNMIISSEMINGVYIPDLQQTVLSKSRDQTFDASVVFQGGLDAQFVDIGSTLNGQQIAGNMAIKGAKNVFSKPLQFKTLTVENLKVDKVNNIDLDEIVLKNTSQVIEGKKSIRKLNASQNILLSGGEINLVNLAEFNKSRMTVSGDQHISGHVTFAGDVDIKGDLHCENINSVNITDLSKKVVTINTPQEILGKKEFATTMHIGKAKFSGKLNNINITDNVLSRSASQIIPHDIVIYGNVHVQGDVDVEDSVNGMDISRDLVTRCGNHTIYGKKVFKDDVFVEEFSNIKESNTWLYPGDVTVNSLETAEINGIKINNYLSQLLRKSIPQTFKGTLNCDKIQFVNVLADQIDGNRLENLYMTTKTDQTISRPVIFEEDVYVRGSVIMKDKAVLNGVDIAKLSEICVTKSGDQIIYGHKTFGKVNSLAGIHTINKESENIGILDHLLHSVDYKLDSLVMLGDNQMSDLKCRFLNDIYLDKFLSQMFMTDSSVSITSGKYFESLIVKGGLDLTTRLNGMDVTEFFQNVVRLSTNQPIHGNVQFLQPVVCHGPVFTKTLNGKDLENQIKNLVKTDRTNKVQGIMKFPKGLQINGDINLQSVNGVNFTQMVKRILTSSTNQIFEGPTFAAGSIYAGNVQVLGEINGVKPSDYVLLNENVTLNSSVHFKGPVEFCSLRVDGKMTIPATSDNLLSFKEFRAKSIDLKGTLNDMNINNLPSVILSKSRYQTIASHITFENDVAVEHIHLRDPIINNVDIHEMRLRALTTNSKQIVTGMKTWAFPSNVSIEGPVLVRGNVATDKYVSPTINSTEMSKNDIQDILRGGKYKGDIIFKDKVEVIGKVNNLDFPKDVFLMKKNQTLPPIVFDGDVEVDRIAITGHVNLINLRELINNRITLSTEQTFDGHIHFQDVVEIEDPIQCKHLKDLHSSDEVPDFLRDFQEDIYSDIVFDQPVEIEGEVKSKYLFNSKPVQRMDTHKKLDKNGTTPCLRSLMKTSQVLSGNINHFEIANELPASHSIGYVIHGGHIYLILAVPTISPATCNNLRILRCDNEVSNCHPSRGIFKLPKGFVKKIYSFENDGKMSLAFVMEKDGHAGINPSNCQKLFDAVFIFIDILRKSRAYFLIPASKVIGVSVLNREVLRQHILLSSSDFGLQIYALEKNVQPQVVAFEEFSAMGIGILKYSPDAFIFATSQNDVGIKFINYVWKKSIKELEHNFAYMMPRNETNFAVFNVGIDMYVVLGGERINVYYVKRTGLMEIQKISQTTKFIEIFEFYGKIHLTALTPTDEIIIYKWTDIFKFTLVTKVKSLYTANRASSAVLLGNLFLFVTPETNSLNSNSSSVVLKGALLGYGQPQECWL